MPLTINNLSKAYDGKEVLKNLDLELPDTGIFCILGDSGSGKTTLLRLIAGLETPDSGTIAGIQGKKISFVFQNDRLMPGFSAFDNVAAVSSPDLAKLWLTRFELDDADEKKPCSLSGGMCRRVALARALAFGGDILLLDEPFKGFDSELKKRIIPYIIEFSEHALVVLVTHDEQEAQIANETFRLAAAN